MNTTVKEAQEQTIFTIEPIGSKSITRNRFITESFKIEPMSLYDFVMQSAEETTSPRGVEPKLHIREKERVCSCVDEDGEFNPECSKCYQGTELVYEVWNWGFRGQKPTKIDTFDTEEEAKNFIFQQIYEFNFTNDNQRDTRYYDSEEKTKEEMILMYADLWNVKKETAVSIIRHTEMADQIIADREYITIQEREALNETERKRIEIIAGEYSKMIQKVVGESYKETAARLSAAIGSRIESKVFHTAVKLIRKL